LGQGGIRGEQGSEVLIVHYQPIVSDHNGAIEGLRLNSSGLAAPGSKSSSACPYFFIPAAEEQFIVLSGASAVGRQLRLWQEMLTESMEEVRMSVGINKNDKVHGRRANRVNSLNLTDLTDTGMRSRKKEQGSSTGKKLPIPCS